VKSFDVIVVGSGLMGSAVARHLSASCDVALVGPAEPVSQADKDDAMVFASHYDQARVFRLLGQDDVWTQLNCDTADALAGIAEESGLVCHLPAGCLVVTTEPDDAYIPTMHAEGSKRGIHHDLLDEEALRQAFPRIWFPEGARGLYEPAPAGAINPRQLIQAQRRCVKKRGGVLIDGVVTSLAPNGEGMTVQLANGEHYHAAQVVVATGAFSSLLALVPDVPPLEVESETVLLVEVPEEAHWSHLLPSTLYEVETDEYNGIYTLPPVRYPDGHVYFKLGCNLPQRDRRFSSLGALQDWFRSGACKDNAGLLRHICGRYFPTLSLEHTATKECVIARTPHRKPIIRFAGQDEGWGQRVLLAMGGNGYGAMSSDGIGGLAVHVLREGVFPAPYSSADFDERGLCD
jgi:sarcosine oxidase